MLCKKDKVLSKQNLYEYKTCQICGHKYDIQAFYQSRSICKHCFKIYIMKKRADGFCSREDLKKEIKKSMIIDKDYFLRATEVEIDKTILTAKYDDIEVKYNKYELEKIEQIRNRRKRCLKV